MPGVTTTAAPAATEDAAPVAPPPPREGRAAGEPTGVRARLRAATAAWHQALERQLDLLGPGLDTASYRRLLAMLYGFHAPLETRLCRAAALAPDLGVPPPRRAHLLARDLAALGMPRAAVRALPRCPSLPRLERPEHVAGCLYVIEGSVLGGRLIAREVERRLGLDAARGASFFHAGSADGNRRWRRLVAALERSAGDGAAVDEMATAARETFASLSRWASRCEVPRAR